MCRERDRYGTDPPRVLVKRRRPCWLRPERRRRRRGDFFGRFQAGARDAGGKSNIGELLLGIVAPVAVARVFRVAGEDLDAAPGTPDVFGAGRQSVRYLL